jgi:hypothetical protein
MAGRGPRPKPADRRARTNKDPIPSREVSVLPVAPMALPMDLLPEGEEWHPATLRWWGRWCESPLAENLPEVDWSELEACAVLHHEFMRKRSFTLGSELRLRMAKWGATPEDRARLRITIADADAKDPGSSKPASGARERRGALRALPSATG